MKILENSLTGIALKSAKYPFSNIINFVMSCEFGVPFNPNQNDIEHEADYYKYLTPQEFEKYKMGVCWDFVTYLVWRFEKEFSELKTYAFWLDNPDWRRDKEEYRTHTIFLVQYNNKVIWIEGAWDQQKGIHEYDSIIDALNTITSNWKKYEKVKYVRCFPYNPLDKKLFGTNGDDTVIYIEKKYGKAANFHYEQFSQSDYKKRLRF